MFSLMDRFFVGNFKGGFFFCVDGLSREGGRVVYNFFVIFIVYLLLDFLGVINIFDFCCIMCFFIGVGWCVRLYLIFCCLEI